MEPELEKLLNEILSNQKKIIKALKIEEIENANNTESNLENITLVIKGRN